MENLLLLSSSPEETEKAAARLAPLLSPGDVITLRGELGAGKTCFARGIATALSPEQGAMASSPTYTIINEYSGEMPVYHMDCYRLRGEEDASELGIEEILHEKGISLIEWPERIQKIMPDEYLDISFEHLDETTRRIRMTPFGQRFTNLLDRLV